MASINDYNWQVPSGAKKPARWMRWGLQIVLAAVFFIGVLYFLPSGGMLGDYARYIAGKGLSQQASWLGVSSVPAGANSSLLQPEFSFVLPFSGVVVRNFQMSETDGTMGKGITISGEPGQIVKATAAGKVVAIARQEDVFAVEIHHSLGYVSIYSGLGELWVAQGDQIEAGDEIGTVSQANLDFYLWQDGQEIDPLEYLFDT